MRGIAPPRRVVLWLWACVIMLVRTLASMARALSLHSDVALIAYQGEASISATHVFLLRPSDHENTKHAVVKRPASFKARDSLLSLRVHVVCGCQFTDKQSTNERACACVRTMAGWTAQV